MVALDLKRKLTAQSKADAKKLRGVDSKDSVDEDCFMTKRSAAENSVNSTRYQSVQADATIQPSKTTAATNVSETCSQCSQLILENSEDGKCCKCWIQWKNICGRMPYASCTACGLTLTGLIVANIALIKVLNSVDEAFKLIDDDERVYQSIRNAIMNITNAVIYSLYGFLLFVFFVAFLASGKNRDLLRRCRKLKRHIFAFIIICIVILGVFLTASYSVSLVLVLPFAVGKLGAVSCHRTVDLYDLYKEVLPINITVPLEWISQRCLDVTFLGTDTKLLCDQENISTFCYYMNLVGIAVGLTAFGANYAYVRSVRHLKKPTVENKKSAPVIDISVNNPSDSVVESEQTAGDEVYYQLADKPHVADESLDKLSVNTEVNKWLKENFQKFK
ncbi:uncharacterized protein LOC142340152 isoform X2 [Convolutriloba macropyga]|uniref:uncharacterized protein LOC142340152 isoform X2 n=1 Tax=Convolutriloba macropyga TaxID=536237 RepID=UPI003F527109